MNVFSRLAEKLPHHPIVVSPMLWGMRPEKSAVRLGQHTGDATNALVNDIPSSKKRRCVLGITSRLPRCASWSSVMSMRMLGFVTATAAAAAPRHSAAAPQFRIIVPIFGE